MSITVTPNIPKPVPISFKLEMDVDKDLFHVIMTAIGATKYSDHISSIFDIMTTAWETYYDEDYYTYQNPLRLS